MSAQADGNILDLEDVHTFYGTIEALKGISINVRQGEVVTLIGANGAGKSTTLRSINGLNHPRRGRIHFQGRDITTASPHDIVERGIAQSPEGRRLFPRMTVLENLLMGTFQRKDRNNRKAVNADLDRVYSLFPRLAERKQQKAGTLSLVEQNALMALDVASRGYVLETGKVALADDAKKLKENEDVKKTYLGAD